MKIIYEKIEGEARPYLDTRSNEIHVSVCYAMAKQLLGHYPEADEVVLPAILLHDVGWKMVPEEKQLGAFGPRAIDTEIRRVHEIEGVRIARRILASLNYDKQDGGDRRDHRGSRFPRRRPFPSMTRSQGRRQAVALFTGGHGDRLPAFRRRPESVCGWLTKRVDIWFLPRPPRDLARRGLAEAGVTKERIPPGNGLVDDVFSIRDRRSTASSRNPFSRQDTRFMIDYRLVAAPGSHAIESAGPVGRRGR